jgi:polar amino acid transport system substrate-binding protein
MSEFVVSRRRALQTLGGTVIAGAFTGISIPAQAEAVTIDKIKKMGKLRIGVEATYPPFTYREGGKIIGYDLDLADIFCNSLGVEPDVIDTQWSGIIPALYAGRFEIVMSSMSYTKERLEKVLFTIPYAEASQALLVREEDKNEIKTIDDMAGRVLGIKLGSPGEVMRPNLEKRLQEARGEGFKSFKIYDDHPSAYLALSQGTVDGVLNTLPTLAKVKKDRPGYYEIVRNVGHENWAGIAMRTSDVEIKQFLDGEIRRLKDDGRIYELQEKWFGLRMDLADDVPSF